MIELKKDSDPSYKYLLVISQVDKQVSSTQSVEVLKCLYKDEMMTGYQSIEIEFPIIDSSLQLDNAALIKVDSDLILGVTNPERYTLSKDIVCYEFIQNITLEDKIPELSEDYETSYPHDATEEFDLFDSSIKKNLFKFYDTKEPNTYNLWVTKTGKVKFANANLKKLIAHKVNRTCESSKDCQFYFDNYFPPRVLGTRIAPHIEDVIDKYLEEIQLAWNEKRTGLQLIKEGVS